MSSKSGRKQLERRIAAGLCPQCPVGHINPMRAGGKACVECIENTRISATRSVLRRAIVGEITLPPDIVALIHDLHVCLTLS